MNLRIIFELLLVVLSLRFTYASSQFRIVKGSPADINKMRHIVALTYHGEIPAFCGGSLVTMQTIVIAAHFLEKRAPSRITVLAGHVSLLYPAQWRKVERTFHSCNYDSKRLQMDIGALKLEAPFHESLTVQVIPLCNIDLNPGTPMQFSGWGTTCSEKDYQTILRTSVSDIITEVRCKWYYENAIYKSMICAENDGSGFCFGDSGGPGVVNGQLCGVVSFTEDSCATSLYPLVYTNVQYIGVLRFIQNVMNC